LKRAVFLVLVVLCVGLCGCNSASAPPQTAAFSATVTLTKGDFTATATLTRAGVGQLQLDCTAPPSLAGLSVLQNGEEIALSKNGLSVSVSPDALPGGALFLNLCRVLDDEALCAADKSGRVDGVCQNQPYTITFDTKTGAPMELQVPNEGISVVFSDFLPDL